MLALRPLSMAVGRHADGAILWLATQAGFAGPEQGVFLDTSAFVLMTLTPTSKGVRHDRCIRNISLRRQFR